MSFIDKVNRRFSGDAIIWMIVLLLCLVSVFAVYSIGGTSRLTGGSAETPQTLSMLFGHAKFIILGVLLMYLFSRIDFRWVGKFSSIALALAFILLICTYIWGTENNEAKRSWNIFGTGIEIQTVQFAELMFVLYFARWIAKLKEDVNKLTKVYIKILIYIALTCGMIMVAKFSGAIIIGLSYLVLLFISQLKFRYFALTIGLSVLVGLFFFNFITSESNKQVLSKLPMRIETPLNRFTQWKSGDNINSDVIHLEAAIATAGILPKTGGSIHKTGVDQSYSDYIFAFTVEEYGILLGVFIVLLYIVLFYRITRAARNVNSVYGYYLAMGIGSFIIFQAFTHISTCVGMIPAVGETLPLVSRGGMSILIFSVCIGILLNISAEVQKEKNNSQDNDINH